jgi:hypothetical protein
VESPESASCPQVNPSVSNIYTISSILEQQEATIEYVLSIFTGWDKSIIRLAINGKTRGLVISDTDLKNTFISGHF